MIYLVVYIVIALTLFLFMVKHDWDMTKADCIEYFILSFLWGLIPFMILENLIFNTEYLLDFIDKQAVKAGRYFGDKK